MRHDYNLPPDWNTLSDEEKSAWMTQERCRRRNQKMEDSTGETDITKLVTEKERIERILEARGYKDLSDNR